jgi:hypothetical protein
VDVMLTRVLLGEISVTEMGMFSPQDIALIPLMVAEWVAAGVAVRRFVSCVLREATENP